jgi:hypothetical protein
MFVYRNKAQKNMKKNFFAKNVCTKEKVLNNFLYLKKNI